MKQIIYLLMVISLSLVFNGCTSTGFRTAEHNGKLYYFPKNCNKYKFYNRNVDKLYCKNKKGKITGRILYPADKQQIANYKYEQKRNREGWKSFADSLNKITEENNKLTASIASTMPRTVYIYNR